MPIPRAGSAQWPTAGERHAKVTLQYATTVEDDISGRTETFSDFGTWWAKVTVVPFIVSDTQSALIYQIEGLYRSDLMAKFMAGTGLRAVVNDQTLKVFQVENPQLKNRTLVAHCAPAVNVQ